MKSGLYPILSTLIVVAIVFGLWFAAIQKGFFFRKSISDVSICRIDKDKVSLRWKDPLYHITGWHAERHDSDVLLVDINITRDRSGNKDNNSVVLTIDTLNVNYLNLFGDSILVSEISTCR